jgi:PAS domain S-box-containing protein
MPSDNGNELIPPQRDERYKILFSKMTDGFALFNAIRNDSGTVVDFQFHEVNQAFEQISILSSTEILGKSILTVLPKNGPFLQEVLENVLQTGEPETIERYVQEIDSHLKVSVYLPVPDLLACVIVDVSYRKRIENALRESEVTFRALVENSFDVIFTLNVIGEFVFVSPSWELHFGFPANEVIGQSFAPVVHPDDIQPCLEYLTKIMTTGASGTSPIYRVKCADGSLRSFVANGGRFLDAKGEVLFLGVGHDVTAQLRAEQERLDFERQLLHTQKLESLGILAGGIAHDFNNLLLTILGNIELATLKLPPELGTKKYLDQATLAANRAADLTSRLLAYSGKGIFLLKRLNLNELVNENATLFRTAVPRTVSIEVSLADGLGDIMADVAQIQQIIMNLITNAAEAIQVPAGRISISTGSHDYSAEELAESVLDVSPKPGRFVYLEVRDNGCGISEEIREKIFDPFFTTKFTGRGLGMSALLGIVKAHFGTLFLDSTPGEGTTIRVALPIATGDSAPAAAPKPVQATAPTDNDNTSPLTGTVLVVDDEKSVLKICATMVRQSGFTVITATDGADAVEIFTRRSNEIDLVLMDLTMPNMDGATAMIELRRIKPDVKIILSSGFNEQELDERLADQKPTGFIRKPYRLQSLSTELQRVMQEREQ